MPPPLDLASRLLHWGVGLAILGLLAMGFIMAQGEIWPLYPWHKSLGIAVLGLAVLRATWRLRQGWPSPLGPGSRLTRGLALAVHGLLLLLTLLMPLSGMAFSGLSGHGFALFGWTLMAPRHDPAQPDEVLPLDESLASLAHQAHEVFGWLLAGLLVLHIAAALKHHLVDGDDTLRRMLGRR